MRTSSLPEATETTAGPAGVARLVEQRASLFPVTRVCRYLDHAAFGPLPSAAASAALEAMSALPLPAHDRWRASRLTERVRAVAAALLHAPVESVCLLKSTSEGISLVARGLEWRPGDEVIVHEREFAGAVYPWLDLKRHGVTVRVVRDDGSGRFSATAFERQMSSRTRAICISLINPTTGYRAPVSDIATLCGRIGAWLVVDAVQAVGAIDVDARSLGADIVAAHSYKFLLAGFGVAVVHCSQRAIEELRPPQVGWKNGPATVGEQWGDDDGPVSRDDGRSAKRFEASLLSVPTLAALEANLTMLQAVREEFPRRIRLLGEELDTGLRKLGYDVVTPPERGAIVAARHPSIDSEEIRARLADHEVIISVRGGLLRFSPHFYNTTPDVEEVLRWLPR